MKFRKVVNTACLLLAALGMAGHASASLMTGWTGQGNYGSTAGDGDITTSPFGSAQFGYVSTDNGVSGLGLPGVGGSGSPELGSVALSPVFAANAGDSLEFFFNYVTSDGAEYSDYAWARLLDSAMNQVALLFTARTTNGGNTVPGFSMPNPEATLSPGSTPIVGGNPDWSILGSDSGSCFATGCGYTGWIKASYTIANTGNYYLQMGVVNWNDNSFDSAMAFDGATVGGNVIGTPVPIPAPLTLMGLGLVALGFARKRK
ncbi:NF038132 family protein [Bowmanella yangjiangensis]|uniref:NF038132 family protein n=1 Tax=Bowmanella yangjiangensis TaxID=2811230 RepID=UPI001E659CB6|nr:NF038132 family protein [Bowmanella yangjiangensis]